MLKMFEPLERFLGIDTLTRKSDVMRTRAVYMMGLAFMATQFINLVTMSYSYGAFTFDHIISVIACVLVGLTIFMLRFNKRFQIYAMAYSGLILVATMSSAMNQNTGINSALIPFFILGVVVNGFICGWRATCVFGGIVLIGIWYLWWVSTNYSYTPLFDPEQFADRNFQRAMQASLATVLITIMGAFFSSSMDEAFEELEDSLELAKASDEAKTNFLATMSHELCTPMNGIVGMNDMLEETNLDEDQRELTAIIRESGQDLQTIIGNVLLYSQLEADRVSLDDSAFDIRALIGKTMESYSRRAAEKGLAFHTRIAPSVPAQVFGDKTRTSQILHALMDNALKFTDKGAVQLSVNGGAEAEGQARLVISVTDTGIGIAEEDQAQIFERFTQKDGTIKRRHGGTGLGLTVARGLTELMGGTLTVKSKPGLGSSFSARLGYGLPEAVVQDVLMAAE